MKLNYKISDLRLDKEDFDLLSNLSLSLKMKNTDLARLLLRLSLKQVRVKGKRVEVGLFFKNEDDSEQKHNSQKEINGGIDY